MYKCDPVSRLASKNSSFLPLSECGGRLTACNSVSQWRQSGGKKSMGRVFSRPEAPAVEAEAKTLLDWVKEGRLDLVQGLSLSSKLLNSKDDMGLTLLHWACDRGHKEMVELLLKNGAEINVQDNDGLTALHYASSCGHGDILKLLLDHKAERAIVDNEGVTAADMALDAGVREILHHYCPPLPTSCS